MVNDFVFIANKVSERLDVNVKVKVSNEQYQLCDDLEVNCN